jgi:L-threonylcarbamoyladenylate synthase
MTRWHLKQAALHVHAGGIIAYPTEAVYGLGCDPYNPAATQHLLDLKKRSIAKGLILIAANMDQIKPFIQPLDKTIRTRISKTWPGPVTWLLPARPETPYWLRGKHDSIAIRITAHPIASALCMAAGIALVSTSANIAGKRPARNALDIRCKFGNHIDYILHGNTGGRKNPSEIRDALTGKMLRAS